MRKDTVAKIIVTFDSEQQASQFINRLADENMGEARARLLSSTEDLSYDKHESTAPMITPGMGSVEVRPSEVPTVPSAQHKDDDEQVSASVPVTGTDGIQVLIEVNDEFEEAVRQLMRDFTSGGSKR
jgi:hypothetical protein